MLDVGDELWLWQGWWPETAADDSNDDTEDADNDDDTMVAKQPMAATIGTTIVDHRGSLWTRLQAERRAAMQTALDYWKQKHGNNKDCAHPKAYLVWAGLEPHQFTDCFPEWYDRDDIAEINMKVLYKRQSIPG